MSDFTVFQIEITKGYDMNAFREAGVSAKGSLALAPPPNVGVLSSRIAHVRI